MNIDGVKNKIIWCFWFGEERSLNRERCLARLKDLNSNVKLITEKNYKNYEKPDNSYHPTFSYLSSTHKSDYLRAYFMHHYGGGYSDIKFFDQSFEPFLEDLYRTPKLGTGVSQKSSLDIANCSETSKIKHEFKKFIGCCNFAFKKNNNFTKEWLNNVELILEKNKNSLIKNPGSYHPRAIRSGAQGTDLQPRGYPFEWTEIMGNVFHPLVYKYSDWINKDYPRSNKEENYR